MVQRDAEGKELRSVTEMSSEEQEMARRICMAFGQNICGFDILRTDGRACVVDVNGWSFVKGNQVYLERCASILRDTFLQASMSKRHSIGLRDEPCASPREGQWRLKCYACVFRHGDRTPKQKLKMTVRQPAFLSLLPPDYGGEDVVIRETTLLTKAYNISEIVLKASQPDQDDYAKLKQLVEVLGKKMKVRGTKIQLRKIVRGEAPSMLLIVKWGGDFTHAGRHQTKDLGENMRKELTILNKTLIDSVKIYCSVERRVMATAEVFAKAFLSTAEVVPDCIAVLKEALDDSFVSKDDVYAVKKRIGERLLDREKRLEVDGSFASPDDDPVHMLRRLRQCLNLHRRIMKENLQSLDWDRFRPRWCCADSLAIFRERWEKHFVDVLDGHYDWFDPSKISDLYDSLKFDSLHHRDLLFAIFTVRNDPDSRQSLHDLYQLAQRLFDFVGPREYGMKGDEKLRIGLQISGLLLKRVVEDVNSSLASNLPLTRLYFTKESHMTGLLNILRSCGLPMADSSDGELDYLSHICFEFYERVGSEGTRYSLRLGLSNGAHASRLLDSQVDRRHALAVGPKRWLTDYMDGLKALGILRRTVIGAETAYGFARSDRKTSEPMSLDPE